jgi:hypothetical protein
MCCIMPRVEYVSDTSIFARFIEKGEQILVYSMKVGAKEDIAMILPIPVARNSGEKAVSFINLEKYPDFFKDMRKGFRQISRGKGGGGGFGAPPPKPKLEVVKVGKFEASYVPTINDFDRLDERFRLPENTWDAIPAYKKYGFVVFKISSMAKAETTEHAYHPMAFRFPSLNRSRLYFPTVHIHDGEIHDKEEFDHALYCQITGGDHSSLTSRLESEQLASAFMDVEKSEGVIEGDEHIYRKLINGRHKNKDIWI